MNVPAKYLFIAIWATLLLVLFGMFGLAQFHLGGTGTAIILALAAIQALLVLLSFMRLWNSNKLVRMVAGVGFLWLLILFVLAFSDYMTRQWH